MIVPAVALAITASCAAGYEIFNDNEGVEAISPTFDSRGPPFQTNCKNVGTNRFLQQMPGNGQTQGTTELAGSVRHLCRWCRPRGKKDAMQVAGRFHGRIVTAANIALCSTTMQLHAVTHAVCSTMGQPRVDCEDDCGTMNE